MLTSYFNTRLIVFSPNSSYESIDILLVLVMVQFWDSIPEHLAEWVRNFPVPQNSSTSYHISSPFPKVPNFSHNHILQALSQSVFFTASAPLTGAHVNISPKGLPSATFTIFTPNSAAYIDATGSGSETVSHVYENGRVTIMFCSFDVSPRILRFFCWGRAVEWDQEEFGGLVRRMGKESRLVEGARAVVDLKVWKVGLRNFLF